MHFSENGNLYCTGNNSSGQLGLGTNVIEIHTPKLLPRGAVQDETICRIACGESHTAIVTGKFLAKSLIHSYQICFLIIAFHDRIWETLHVRRWEAWKVRPGGKRKQRS